MKSCTLVLYERMIKLFNDHVLLNENAGNSSTNKIPCDANAVIIALMHCMGVPITISVYAQIH